MLNPAVADQTLAVTRDPDCRGIAVLEVEFRKLNRRGVIPGACFAVTPANFDHRARHLAAVDLVKFTVEAVEIVNRRLAGIAGLEIGDVSKGAAYAFVGQKRLLVGGGIVEHPKRGANQQVTLFILLDGLLPLPLNAVNGEITVVERQHG